MCSRRDVALVRREVVLRVLLVQPRHDPVPGHLGDDRRGGDAGRDPVALPHRQPGDLQAVDGEPVGQHVRRAYVEPRQRPAQRLDVRDVHAEPVALVVLDDHDRPGEGTALHLDVRALPGRGGQQLGVGEPGDLAPLAVGQHHRGGDQRAGAGAAPGLVDARDRVEPDAAQGPFVAVEAGVLADGETSGKSCHDSPFVARRRKGYLTDPNVAGVCSACACPNGQTTAKTLPTTSSTGTCPPPGSPRWTRESAEFDRLSPCTHR